MKLPRGSVQRVVDQFDGLDLGDPRRVVRLRRVLARMARAPAVSLPAAMGDDASLQGAYRLMNNPAMVFDQLIRQLKEIARRRAETVGDVLVLHDTTSCSFPDLDPREIGYLPTGKAGFLLHLSLVVDADGWRRPLGVANVEPLFRRRRSGRGSRKRKVSGNVSATWKDREYERWWRGMQASAEVTKGARVVHVADRESDSYELMAKMHQAKYRFVFRVRLDRRGRHGGDEDWSTVREVATRAQGQLERDVPLSRREKKSAPRMNKTHLPRKMRLARLAFASTIVEIPRPRYLGDHYPATLMLNLVHVREVDAPSGEPAVEWLLYTTEAIDRPEDVAKVVDDYRTRWVIEEFNSALKTGCGYEDRQFESKHALLAMLALSLPIACEVLALRSLARSSPDVPATGVLSQRQLQLLGRLNPKLPPRPSVQDALLGVAALGGHLKRNGPPGWKVLSRGMTELLTYEAGFVAGINARRRRGRADL